MLSTIPFAEDLTTSPVQLGSISGLYFTGPDSHSDTALLYLHGGAYVIGSAQGYRSLAAELGRAAGASCYAIDYRLAPEHPFPAAVEDAVEAYKAMLLGGLSPAKIAIAGDSAGGGLALAALIALRDQGLPMPAAALLISPWADLTCTAVSLTKKADEDPSLTAAGLRATADLYLAGASANDPRASPIFADLAGLPPILIQVGTSEILLDDALKVSKRAALSGVDTHLRVWPEMIHVWHAFAFMLPEGRAAISEAGAFLQTHLAQR
jgi:acetyl esterase/lipase